MLPGLIQDTFSVAEDVGLNVLGGAEVRAELNTVVICIYPILGKDLEVMDANEPVELLADLLPVEEHGLYAGPHIIEGLDDVIADANACDFHDLCVLIRWC